MDIDVETLIDLEIVGDGLYQIHIPVQFEWAILQIRLVSSEIVRFHIHYVVRTGDQRTIGILVDRRIEYTAAFSGSVGVDVRPPSCQPQSQGCPRSDIFSHCMPLA